MTVREVLLKQTQVGELCVIVESGYIIATAWIDAEDLFVVHENICSMIVESQEWKDLPITTAHGDTIKVPAHYIHAKRS